MAQAGYTPISLYYSTTAAAVPTSGNLASGELAINITDGKLYYKSNAGVVTLLAGATSGPAGGSNTQVQYNSSGVLAGSSNMTFDGTTLTANALTVTNAVTLSGGTANGVAYLNGSKVVTSGSALNYATGTGTGNLLEVTGGSNNINGQINIQGTDGTNTSFVSLLSGLEPTNLPSLFFSNGLRFALATNKAASGYSEQMRLTSTGLGIGTSSPATKLDVVGSAQIGASTAKTKFYSDADYNGIFNGASLGSNESIYMGVGAQFFYASGSERMRLTSTGLGIGTSSPSVKLDIAGAGVSTPAAIFRAAAGVGNAGGLGLYTAATDTNARNWYLVANSNSYGDLVIKVGASQGADPTSGTSVATFSSSGNLGLGVTPSAWSSQAKAIQLGAYAGFYQNASGLTAASFNSFQNTSNTDTYRVSANPATKYELGGGHAWYVAPSGTAGNAITFTQAMTLDASGNLGVGTTSPSFKLDVNGTFGLGTGQTGNIGVFGANTATGDTYFRLRNTAGAFDIGTSATGHYLYGQGSLPLQFFTNATERARIDSSGNLLVGTTTAGGRLTVATTTAVDATLTLKAELANYASVLNIEAQNDNGAIYNYIASNTTGVTQHWKISGGAANNTMAFSTGGTERARITSGGNFIINNGSTVLDTALLTVNCTAGTGNTTPLSLRVGVDSDGYTAQTFRNQSGIQGGIACNTTSISMSGVSGITFKATQVASADANTLDDYEEGTFTPTAVGATIAGATTYTLQQGTYTKIGRQVTLSVRLSWSAMTGIGELTFGGFPFTSANDSMEYMAPFMSDQLNWDAGTYLQLYKNPNTTTGVAFCVADDVSWVVQQCVNETAAVRFTITYFV